MTDGLRTRLAVFVVVLVIAVTAVAAAGVVTEQGSTERPTMDHPQFESDAVAVDGFDRGGEITFDDDGESKTVVIDVAHANDVTESDLQPVVSALTAEGHTVEYHAQDQMSMQEPDEALAETLQDADAFVVFDPGVRYTADEAEVVEEFADADGRVLFAGGPNTSGAAADLLGLVGGAAEIDQGEFASVTSQLGIAYDTGYLYDVESAGNYRTLGVTPASDGALTDGVDEVVFDRPTAVVSEGETVLTTAEVAEHSESREAGEYGVAVQHENAIAVGDTGFMTTANHNVADNEIFIGNVLEFLVTGDKEPGEPDVASEEPVPGAEHGAEHGTAPAESEMAG